MPAVHHGSVTRIADFTGAEPPHAPLPRDRWKAGDYVVAEVRPRRNRVIDFELASGRKCRPMAGDLVVGALAVRRATLEHVGSYEDVGPDGAMFALSEGGCLGALTSRAPFSKPLLPLQYRGHVIRKGQPVRMGDFVVPHDPVDFAIPTALLVGTSMSAGKTFSARVVVRLLKRLGFSVVAGKLTGTGRWQDTRSMGDAGADHIVDFVDAGLPTTVCPPTRYRAAMEGLLARMAATGCDACVIEAGASPLEPYNGGTLVSMLGEQVVFTLLAASDPYAVVGIQTAWKREFDLVAGPAANTSASVELVRRLSGLPALDLIDDANHGALEAMLARAFGAEATG